MGEERLGPPVLSPPEREGPCPPTRGGRRPQGDDPSTEVPCPGCLRNFSSLACTTTSWRAAADSVPIELTSECKACGVATCDSCAVCKSCLDSAQQHDDPSTDDDDDDDDDEY